MLITVRTVTTTLVLALVSAFFAVPCGADVQPTVTPGTAAALLADATAAFDAFELDKATRALQTLEQQSGRSATILYYRTRILALRNQPAAALKIATNCVTQYPTASRCHEALADAQLTAAFATGKMLDIISGARAAKDSWEKALTLDPANTRAALLLIRYYRQAPWPIGSTDRAHDLEKQIGRYDAAAGAQAKGLNLLSDKAYPAAVAALNNAIALNPRDRDARYYLVATRVEAKQYQAAAVAAEDLVTRYPKFWVAWLTLGFVHRDGKLDPTRGIDAVRMFLLHADNPSPNQRAAALGCIGSFEERLGHVDVARTAFQQAIALNADDKSAKEGLARIGKG